MKVVKNVKRLKIVEQIIIVSILSVVITLTICGFVVNNINQHSVRAQLCEIGQIVANSVSDSIDVYIESINHELRQVSVTLDYFPTVSSKKAYLNKIKTGSSI